MNPLLVTLAGENPVAPVSVAPAIDINHIVIIGLVAVTAYYLYKKKVF